MTISEKPLPKVNLEEEIARRVQQLRTSLNIFATTERAKILAFQLSASRLCWITRRRVNHAEQDLAALGVELDVISDEELPRLVQNIFSEGEKRERGVGAAKLAMADLILPNQELAIERSGDGTDLSPASDQPVPSRYQNEPQ